jgi:undecaprenyl-diphosphatase
MLVLQASDMHAWDRTAFLWLNLDAHSPDLLVTLAVLASRWLPGVALAGLMAALLAGPARWRRQLLTTAAAMALAWLGASLIKQGVTAPRPFMLGLGTDWLGHAGGNGFPSSHASVASALGVSALLSSWPRAMRWALTFLAAVVCWSRIAVGVHFPSDVAAATLLGVLCALLLQGTTGWWLLRRARLRERWPTESGQAS